MQSLDLAEDSKFGKEDMRQSPRRLHRVTGCTCKLMRLSSQELQLLLESVDGAPCSAFWLNCTGHKSLNWKIVSITDSIFWPEVELWEMAPVVNFLSGLSADMTVSDPKLCFWLWPSNV